MAIAIPPGPVVAGDIAQNLGAAGPITVLPVAGVFTPLVLAAASVYTSGGVINDPDGFTINTPGTYEVVYTITLFATAVGGTVTLDVALNGIPTGTAITFASTFVGFTVAIAGTGTIQINPADVPATIELWAAPGTAGNTVRVDTVNFYLKRIGPP